MEFRNVFISNSAKLSVSNAQLVIEQDEKVTIPIEDIGCVLIESQQVTITAATLSALSDSGVNLFTCDEKHMPCGTLLPMNSHCRQLKVLKKQIEISKPVEKQIWKEIVVRKIENQAQCLALSHRPGADVLRNMAKAVVSGDAENVEAKAAAYYFPALFGSGFYRGEDVAVNSALNYGYAIIRGIIARNLVVRGLEPCIGIHHHSELNQFNLADDLIEPFRPVIDRLVHSMNLQPDEEMSPQLKHSIFNVANLVIALDNKKFRVYSAIGRSVMSFSQSVEANANKIELPSLLPLEEYRYA